MSPDLPSYLSCRPAVPTWFVWLLRGGRKQARCTPRGSGTAGASPPSRRACGERGHSWDTQTPFSPGPERGLTRGLQGAQQSQDQPGDHESMTRPPSWKGHHEARSPTGEPGAGDWAPPLGRSWLGRGGVGEGCSGEVPGPAFLENSAVRGAMPSTFKTSPHLMCVAFLGTQLHYHSHFTNRCLSLSGPNEWLARSHCESARLPGAARAPDHAVSPASGPHALTTRCEVRRDLAGC